MDVVGQNLYRRLEGLRDSRSTWDSNCQRIAKRVWPDWSGQFSRLHNSSFQLTEGKNETDEMLDATAAIASERFSAIMESMLTPRGSKWHILQASDKSLMRKRRVALYFDEITDILFNHRYQPMANYASNSHDLWRSLGVFGTGVLFIDELDKVNGIRYKVLHPASVYFTLNHQGLVDTFFRVFTLTARQALQKYPKGLPEKILEKANGSGTKPDEKFEFLHVVMPREDVDIQRADFRGMAFASYHIAECEKHLIKENGYRTFPVSVSRYVVSPEEAWGRSPAMLAMPAINVLQEEKKTILKQGHRALDPVLLAHDDGVIDTFSMRPGAVNAGTMTADGKRLVDVLPSGNIAVGKDLMDDERMTINDIFLITLFQILVDTPQMTATEVLERAREKGALISPTLGRQESEMLGPQIERELDVLTAQDLLPPMPPELLEAQGEYSIQYDSPLRRAMQAEELVGVYRSMEFAERYSTVTQDLSPYDWFDVDEITPEIMRGNAVPERFRRTLESVKGIRDDRLEQQQVQQAVDAAPAAAGLMKAAP